MLRHRECLAWRDGLLLPGVWRSRQQCFSCSMRALPVSSGAGICSRTKLPERVCLSPCRQLGSGRIGPVAPKKLPPETRVQWLEPGPTAIAEYLPPMQEEGVFSPAEIVRRVPNLPVASRVQELEPDLSATAG